MMESTNGAALLSPFDLRGVSLKDRIVMAPMTRARAGEERLPNSLMAEYYALSMAMRDIIYFMNLMQEILHHKIDLPQVTKPTVTCRVFEDNVGALELMNTHKLCPRMKHLAVQLHHFRQYVLDKWILVEKIATKYQRADIFTKALPRDAFRYL